MEAEREGLIETTCVCRLQVSETGFDSCGALTSGPDEPLCDMCVRNEHAEEPNFAPIIKGGMAWKT